MYFLNINLFYLLYIEIYRYDCQGFFTEGIWAGIIFGLIIAAMLTWAVSMLADVKSPDRFDDPKGKTITITATD